MLDWETEHSDTMTFMMVEIEHVIVSGLRMHQMYDKLAKKVAKMPELYDPTLSPGKNSFEKVKIDGRTLVKMFDDSYEKINSDNYEEEHDFPAMQDGRSFKSNKDLILTALLIYKHNYMTVQEISNIMDLYSKFTMSRTDEEGTVTKEQETVIMIF